MLRKVRPETSTPLWLSKNCCRWQKKKKKSSPLWIDDVIYESRFQGEWVWLDSGIGVPVGAKVKVTPGGQRLLVDDAGKVKHSQSTRKSPMTFQSPLELAVSLNSRRSNRFLFFCPGAQFVSGARRLPQDHAPYVSGGGGRHDQTGWHDRGWPATKLAAAPQTRNHLCTFHASFALDGVLGEWKHRLQMFEICWAASAKKINPSGESLLQISSNKPLWLSLPIPCSDVLKKKKTVNVRA